MMGCPISAYLPACDEDAIPLAADLLREVNRIAALPLDNDDRFTAAAIVQCIRTSEKLEFNQLTADHVQPLINLLTDSRPAGRKFGIIPTMGMLGFW